MADYHAGLALHVSDRVYQRDAYDARDAPVLQPDIRWRDRLLPPMAWAGRPVTSVTDRFVCAAVGRRRHPLFAGSWTPGGRRLLTAASNGEFTLWNAQTFRIEHPYTAHDAAVRTLKWSHDDQVMLSGDDSGLVKYWQHTSQIHEVTAHSEAIRGLAFSPSDLKYCTASDDGLVRLWDFMTGEKDGELKGHGWDIRTVDWHPSSSLIASGGKDNTMRLWDARSQTLLSTLHGHKNTVTCVKWNQNGNWLLSSGRDQSIYVYDVRTMRDFGQFKGHTTEVCTLDWHPIHETLFVSGGADGSIVYWLVGSEEPEHVIGPPNTTPAHESNVWVLIWHPLGHMLASLGNDHSAKFWARSRPGEDAHPPRYVEEAIPTAATSFDRLMPIVAAPVAIPQQQMPPPPSKGGPVMMRPQSMRPQWE